MSEDSKSRLVHLSAQERQALVARLLNNRRAGQARDIVPVPRTTTRFPLSFAQQRIWVLQQLFPATTGFTVVQTYQLRGALDREALGQSLRDITGRHEALRTVFELHEGQPVQRIDPAFELMPTYEDLRGLAEADRPAEVARRAREEIGRLWNLAAGPPLRAWVGQLAEDEHAFMLVMHHILCDGWSLNVIARELFACYLARGTGSEPALSPLPLQVRGLRGVAPAPAREREPRDRARVLAAEDGRCPDPAAAAIRHRNDVHVRARPPG